MRMFRNTPIKRKLLLIGLLTSGVALLFTCSAFIIYEQQIFSSNLVDENLATAALIGDNSAAALSFNDKDAAATLLRSLNHHAAVAAAAIYDKDGKLFAAYRNATASAIKLPPVEHNTHHFGDQGLELFSDIELDGETIGTVYIHHDLSETRAVQQRYVIIATLVMAAALLINWLISSRLYRIISTPISHLSTVVTVVTSEKNYAVRAVRQGDDELGGLVDGFNEMLQQIQRRDHALQEARTDLENRVDARTRELASSLALLNAIFESSPDGFISFQFGKGVVCCNSQYQEMWGMPAELLGAAAGNEPKRLALIAAQLKDPQRFLARQQQIQANRETDVFDVLELKDGRIVERYIKPQSIDGKNVGVVVSFRDITERKRTEQELENIHRQLLDASRKAGMAEVASNVLHNVGNVLNSVNVSTNLLTENTKRSKVASLAKVAGLLREHTGDLAAFIADDPKGKLLPGFLEQLCEHLLGEQQTAVKELDSLRNNIDHIKEIVAMQQSHSKVSGVKEIVDVIDLVEDALRMNSGSLRRHGVEISREFDAVPMLNTEKHKILHILVNLVGNANHACSGSGRIDKRITLRVNHRDDLLKIAVIDNGVGISADNLTRIFGHGFTTKKDGHGFGLHSGALAARELGGDLRVHSDGPGLGATFTLELPLQLTEAAYA